MNVEVNIKETNLQPNGALLERAYTDMIVIHHTGSVTDMDASAAQIDQWHKNHQPDPWTMIGYHFVVRKDGTIERGRPIWAVGAHAGENGMNSHSIGIHLSGDFNAAQPTEAQIEMTSMLIAYLCEKYNIPTDRQHIKGHREVGSTDCPGKNLFALLDTLSGNANWYRYGPPHEEKPNPDAVIKAKVYIRSYNPISESDVQKINDIFKQSLCPNESMFNSIDDFKSFDGMSTIIIGGDGPYERSIEV